VSPALAEAIAGLYAAFKPYKPDEHRIGCDHCTTDRDHADIHSDSLKRLSGAALSRFAFKAMTTWGTEDNYRHFLPRLFELLVARQLDTDDEIVFHKLTYGQWTTWPAVEQQAVARFLHAYWADAIQQYPHTPPIETVVCSVAQAWDDVSVVLDSWPIATSCAAARHFADFVDLSDCNLVKRPPIVRGLQNAFWSSERESQRRLVEQWVKSPERQAELELAFFRFGPSSEEVSQQLSAAVSHLEWLKSASA
jgi:hypothetical protein